MQLGDYADLCANTYYGTGPELVTVGDLVFGVYEREGHHHVVFRGSSNRTNWLRNLNVTPAKTAKGYRTHGGILGAFKTVWPEIATRIPSDPAQVIAVGHSLGAGIAVEMAHHLGCTAVTFGCPRLWWDEDDAPTIDHIRIACDDDPVPLVPLFLFKHDRPEAIILSDGDCEIINADDHNIMIYQQRLLQYKTVLA